MKIIVPATQASFDVRLEKGAATITLPENFDADNPHNAQSLKDLVSMLKAGSVVVPGMEKFALIATPGGQQQQQVQTAPPVEGTPQFATADQVTQLQQQVQQLEQIIMQLTGGSQQSQSGGAVPVPPAGQTAKPQTGAQQGQPAAGSPPLPPPASAQPPQPAAKAAGNRWGGLV